MRSWLRNKGRRKSRRWSQIPLLQPGRCSTISSRIMTFGIQSSTFQTSQSTSDNRGLTALPLVQGMPLEDLLLDLEELASHPGWKVFLARASQLADQDHRALLQAVDPHSLAVQQGRSQVWEKFLNLHQELVEEVKRNLKRVQEDEREE